MGSRSSLYGIVTPRNNCIEDLLHGTLSLQNVNDAYCGFAISDEEEVRIDTHRGLIVPSFKKIPVGFNGYAGIGFVGTNRQPIKKLSRIGEYAIAIDGYLRNADDLRSKLSFKGHSFSSDQDAEIIEALIAECFNATEGMESALGKIVGACNILLLGKEGIFAGRDLHGFRPLSLGQRGNEWAVSSDTCAFNNGSGFTFIREIAPGEIVFIGKEGPVRDCLFEGIHVQKRCSMVWTYDTEPDSVVDQMPVARVRHRLGANLVEADLKKHCFTPDDTVVGAVPNSGNLFAEGYSLASHLPMVALFRSVKHVPEYGHLSLAERKKQKVNRLSPIKENINGKRIVLFDDRLMGGDTIKGIVKRLFEYGAKEVHVRIAFPKVYTECPFSAPLAEKEEFLALSKRTSDIKRIIRATSVRFQGNTHDVANAIGRQHDTLCFDCCIKASG